VYYGYGIEANINWKYGLEGEWTRYDELLPAINRSDIDQVSLECANSRVPLELLRRLPAKIVQAGVIDVATPEAESPEQVAATLRTVFDHVDRKRLIASTNCGMAPLSRTVAVGKATGARRWRSARLSHHHVDQIKRPTTRQRGRGTPPSAPE
jgi:5-methyltetrahydropteroyltriglutamate--homocysteine methyltransferase